MVLIVIIDVIIVVFAMIGFYNVLCFFKEKWFPSNEEYIPHVFLDPHDIHGEYIFTKCFKVKHVHQVAKEMNVTLTHEELMRVVNAVKDNFDLTIGISASEIRVAIDYVLDNIRKKNDKTYPAT